MTTTKDAHPVPATSAHEAAPSTLTPRGQHAQRRFLRVAQRRYTSFGRAWTNWKAVTDQLLARPAPDVVAGLLAALDILPPEDAASRHLLESLVAAMVHQRDMAGLRECLRRFPDVKQRAQSWVYGLSREVLLAEPPLEDALREAALNAILNPLVAGSHALVAGMWGDAAVAAWRANALEHVQAAFRRALEVGPALAEFARFAQDARRIAVVGNGPSLKGAGRGAEIDAQDLVVRCNFPPIAGFASDVGDRTDAVVSFVSPAASNFKEYFGNDPRYADSWFLQMSSSVMRDHQPIPKGLPQRVGVRHFARVPLPVIEAIEDVSYREPTTGLHAILLFSVLLGKEVRLFGFDFFQSGLHHYWKTAAAAATSTHNPRFERLYVQRCLVPLFGVHV